MLSCSCGTLVTHRYGVNCRNVAMVCFCLVCNYIQYSLHNARLKIPRVVLHKTNLHLYIDFGHSSLVCVQPVSLKKINEANVGFVFFSMQCPKNFI